MKNTKTEERTMAKDFCDHCGSSIPSISGGTTCVCCNPQAAANLEARWVKAVELLGCMSDGVSPADAIVALKARCTKAETKRDQYLRQRDKWHGAAVLAQKERDALDVEIVRLKGNAMLVFARQMLAGDIPSEPIPPEVSLVETDIVVTDRERAWAQTLKAAASAHSEMGGENTITDGVGGCWDKTCPMCGADTMEIVRPGKVQCSNCG